MDPELQEITLRVLSYPAALLVAFVVLKLRKRPLLEFFGLDALPTAAQAKVYLLGYIPIFIACELFYYGLSLNEGRIWDHSTLVTAIKAVGIILLAPIAEELIFRGVLYKAVSDLIKNDFVTIFAITIIFTSVHFQYGILNLLTIFISTLYWTWVRYKTGSTVLPVIMHMFNNTISVLEAVWINKMLEGG